MPYKIIASFSLLTKILADFLGRFTKFTARQTQQSLYLTL